jgi:hypothetical protein
VTDHLGATAYTSVFTDCAQRDCRGDKKTSVEVKTRENMFGVSRAKRTAARFVITCSFAWRERVIIVPCDVIAAKQQTLALPW